MKSSPATLSEELLELVCVRQGEVQLVVKAILSEVDEVR